MYGPHLTPIHPEARTSFQSFPVIFLLARDVHEAPKTSLRGPARMASAERAIVDEIIGSIMEELGGNREFLPFFSKFGLTLT